MTPRSLANKLGFAPPGPALALVLILAAATARAQNGGPNLQPGTGITFSTLTGTNGAPYSGDTEGDFTVTPTDGNWFQSRAYGNAPPSIYDGPINSPRVGSLLITDSAGLFTLTSFDFSSNNGNSTYDVQGYHGASLAYEETGNLPGSFPPGFGFQTIYDTHASVPIDGLIIVISPGTGVTSVNLDNIMVSTIPEPAGLGLLGVGLALLFRCRKSSASKAAPQS